MFAKEFKNIFKKTIMILSFLSLGPIIYFLDNLFVHTGFDYRIVFAFLFFIIMLWIDSVYCYSFYRFEDNDRAWEYLLSLPLSRKKIYWCKMLPRLAVILVLLSFYTVLYYMYLSNIDVKGFFLIYPAFLAITLLPLLFLASFIGWANRNEGLWKVYCLFWFSFLFLPFKFGKVISSILGPSITLDQARMYSFALVFLLLTILFIYPFVKVFRQFDLRPKVFHGNKFSSLAFIPMIIFLLISILIINLV